MSQGREVSGEAVVTSVVTSRRHASGLKRVGSTEFGVGVQGCRPPS